MCLILLLKDDIGCGMKSIDCAANMQTAVKACGLLWSLHGRLPVHLRTHTHPATQAGEYRANSTWKERECAELFWLNKQGVNYKGDIHFKAFTNKQTGWYCSLCCRLLSLQLGSCSQEGKWGEYSCRSNCLKSKHEGGSTLGSKMVQLKKSPAGRLYHCCRGSLTHTNTHAPGVFWYL